MDDRMGRADPWSAAGPRPAPRIGLILDVITQEPTGASAADQGVRPTFLSRLVNALANERCEFRDVASERLNGSLQ